MLTKKEMYEKAVALLEELEDDYDVIGIRYEDRDLQIGDVVGNSRHNIDRDDERDYPDYGTEEYFEMEELDGASSWHPHIWEEMLLRGHLSSVDDPADTRIIAYHAYLIGGDISNDDGDGTLDYGETVIAEAKVLYKFF